MKRALIKETSSPEARIVMVNFIAVIPGRMQVTITV